MQAVLDREVFQIAQPGIDAAQRVVRGVGGADAGFARQAGSLRGFDDQLRQPLAAAAIEPVGLGIFVDQPLEFARVAGKAAATSGGGRWPMVTPAMRRLACAASPGLLTMKG